MRGGERVLDRLARMYGPTTLYTLVDDGRPLSDAISACVVQTSPLQRFPGAARRMRRWYLPLMRWAVERIDVKDCDVLVSTSSAVMKSIKAPAGVPHLCYCHSPARYIWDQQSDYDHGSGGVLRGAGLRMLRKRFQEWDCRTADRVTQFIANSQHTARRIQECYSRESIVIYPPVRTEFFTVDKTIPREEFYLVVAALEPYKRTDLVVDAAKRSGFRLKIVGGGSQESALRESAAGHANIELLGRVYDEQLRTLYRQARALIFPQMEDFGIIAVEAQACGCPVIAYNKGGGAETVTEHTGVQFAEQSEGAICDAVQQFERRSFVAQHCRDNAECFSEAAFDNSIARQVNQLQSK